MSGNPQPTTKMAAGSSATMRATSLSAGEPARALIARRPAHPILARSGPSLAPTCLSARPDRHVHSSACARSPKAAGGALFEGRSLSPAATAAIELAAARGSSCERRGPAARATVSRHGVASLGLAACLSLPASGRQPQCHSSKGDCHAPRSRAASLRALRRIRSVTCVRLGTVGPCCVRPCREKGACVRTCALEKMSCVDAIERILSQSMRNRARATLQTPSRASTKVTL